MALIKENDLENAKHKDKIPCLCDYCFEAKLKTKSSILNGRKVIIKDCCSKKECMQKKREEVTLKKFGVKNYFQTEQSKKIKRKYNKEKTIETNLKRYGKAHYTQTKEYKSKSQETFEKNYGNKCYFKTQDYKNKMDEYIEKNPNHTKQMLKNSIVSIRKKYNVENPSQINGHKEKTIKTCQKKYGKGHYSQTDEWKDRVINTSLEKYDKTHYTKTDEYKRRQRQTLIKKYGVTCYALTEECKAINMKRHGVPYGFLTNSKTKQQDELKNWLKSLGLVFDPNYDILNGKEIDLYNDALKLGIEYCGLHWHHELSPEPRLRNYHYEKYKTCLEKGVFLITMFSDEWIHRQSQCKDVLKSKMGIFDKKIYARECEFSVINNAKANQFLDMNHIQGRPSNILFGGGLFFNEELIGVMTFGKHHRGKNEIVLNRFCFSDGHQILGGASKLLKHCIGCGNLRKASNGRIFSWTDNRWSMGYVYEKLGFRLDAELPPDYSYVDLDRPQRRISKQSQKKSNTGCPKDVTEKEWASWNNLARIWDCGKKRWNLQIPRR